MEVQFNIRRKSQLIGTGLEAYFDDLIAQSVNNNADLTTKSGLGNAFFKFSNVDNDETSVDERMMFTNNPIVRVTQFPVFIFAKKGFEDNEVFSGLPYREILQFDENDDPLPDVIRLFKDWHMEGNTAIIRENENWVLIRTQVSGTDLTDTELETLRALHWASLGVPNFTPATADTMTTTDFMLWGMKEFKANVDTFFPTVIPE